MMVTLGVVMMTFQMNAESPHSGVARVDDGDLVSERHGFGLTRLLRAERD